MLGPLSTYASSMRQRQWVHPSDHVLHRDRGSVALGGRWDVARAVPEPTSQTEPCACSDAARAAAFCADIALNHRFGGLLYSTVLYSTVQTDLSCGCCTGAQPST